MWTAVLIGPSRPDTGEAPVLARIASRHATFGEARRAARDAWGVTRAERPHPDGQVWIFDDEDPQWSHFAAAGAPGEAR